MLTSVSSNENATTHDDSSIVIPNSGGIVGMCGIDEDDDNFVRETGCCSDGIRPHYSALRENLPDESNNNYNLSRHQLA